MFTKSKIIISGSIIEIFDYEKELFYGKLPKQKRPKKIIIRKKNGTRSAVSFYRAKSRVRRLIDTNMEQSDGKLRPRFVTFTFKENITEIKLANSYFTKFIRKFKQFLKTKNVKLKYITVIEFQKRGAVHYHSIFFNLPYFANMYDVMEKMWGHGFVISKKINQIKSLSSYVCKYMVKDLDDDRLYGEKCYFTSMKLNQPRTIYNESAKQFIVEFMPDEIPLYEKPFPSEHYDNIYYRRFDLTKHKQTRDDLLAFLK